MTKLLQSIKAVLIALILISIFLNSCQKSFVSEKSKTIKINTAYSFPAMIDGNHYYLTDSTSIIYKNNTVLYAIMPNHRLQFINNKLLKDSVEYKYFIVQNGEKYGFMFDSLKTLTSRKFPSDSILKKNGFLDGDLFKNKNDYVLYKSMKQKGEFLRKEIYLSKFKVDREPDTIKVYYTKKRHNIPFSLSESLDKRKKLKVSKIDFTYNAFYDKVHNKEFPTSTMWFSLKEDTSSDLSKYDIFIDNFNNKNKK